jgi:hypothetical protein
MIQASKWRLSLITDVSEVIVRKTSPDTKNINSEKGQAIFEFLVFLPLLILLYILSVSVNGAINASINQQKITRGYLYARLKNNSTYPPPDLLKSSIRSAGMFVTGWREKTLGDTEGVPLAPCFPIPVFGEASNKDTCDAGGSETTTGFIRVETVYGICGATWDWNEGGAVLSVAPASRSSCEYK